MPRQSSKLSFIVAPADEGRRLDTVCASECDEVSRSYFQKLAAEGYITVDGVCVTDKNFRLAAGMLVEAQIPDASPKDPEPEDIPLDIVYEDDAIVIVNKARGMVVHPAPGNETGTLVNALLARYGDPLREVGDPARPGIVHRMDKETSGLLVCARTPEAYASLRAQFDKHDIERKYMALCYNNLPAETGRIDVPIGRNPVNRLKRAANGEDARPAVTEYRIISRFGSYTLVECSLYTGRTHQIRVHMAYIGNPLVGDTLYGPKRDRFALGGQALYAEVLGFTHPETGAFVRFTCDEPDWFTKAVNKVKTRQQAAT